MSSMSFVNVLDVDDPMIVTVLEFAARFSSWYLAFASCALALWPARISAHMTNAAQQSVRSALLRNITSPTGDLPNYSTTPGFIAGETTIQAEV
jgi:hypothetical protein